MGLGLLPGSLLGPKHGLDPVPDFRTHQRLMQTVVGRPTEGSAEALVESGVYAARVATSFIMVSNSMGVSFPSRRCRRLRW